VDANFDRHVAFLANIDRFSSLYAAESAVQGWLARGMRERGYAVDCLALADSPLAAHPKASAMVEADPARPVQVVSADRPASPAGQSLVRQGHLDMVVEGPAEMCGHPPHAAVIRNG
jgi:acetylornithine deacetylase